MKRERQELCNRIKFLKSKKKRRYYKKTYGNVKPRMKALKFYWKT